MCPTQYSLIASKRCDLVTPFTVYFFITIANNRRHRNSDDQRTPNVNSGSSGGSTPNRDVIDQNRAARRYIATFSVSVIMLLFLGVFVSASGLPHACKHDVYQDKMLRSAPPIPLATCKGTWYEKGDGADFREPMRLIFDTSQVSSSARAILDPIFINVQEFFDALLMVKPLSRTFVSKGNVRITDCDLFVEVDMGDFASDSTTIAQAWSSDWNDDDEEDCGRPVAGGISVNVNRMPSAAESMSSGERKYFMTIVHEVMHIVGFSQGLFARWISIKHELGTYEKQVTDERFGMTRGWLRTPAINEWIRERFHIIDPDYADVGLELEDGGGVGTMGSHPNERLFFSEVMQGRTYGASWFSGLMGAAIWDSGWYTVNESMIEPLVYMDTEYSNEYDRLTLSAINDPPQIGFPETVFCDTQEEGCFYDYVFSGVCAGIYATELNEDSDDPEKVAAAANSAWYNPLSQKIVGSDSLIDYARVLVPGKRNCRDETYSSVLNDNSDYDPSKASETYGPNSVCAISTLRDSIINSESKGGKCYEVICRSDDRMTFLVGDTEVLCLEANMTFSVEGFSGRIWCPPAKAACAALPKVTVINMLLVSPNAGPMDGQNVIRIDGSDYDLYPDMKITIGEDIPCEIQHKSDNMILCRVGKIDDKSLKGKYQALTASSESAEITTTVPDMYLITSRTYSGAKMGYTPALVLLVMMLTASVFV